MVEWPSAADIIRRLELKPHPEGGHYRETFRDTRLDANGRSLSTAIHFLLARGERALWLLFTLLLPAFCRRGANARTGTASMRWRSGIITQATP